MADTNFLSILDMLRQIHVNHPDLRFGEVVQGACDKYRRNNNTNLHDVSSKALLVMLQDFDSNAKAAKELEAQRIARIERRKV